MIRQRTDESVDLLVLGDSQVAIPGRIFRDERLGAIAAAERSAYRSRLAAGHGYDDEHRRNLAALQTEQLQHRNHPGGYWIAEADPKAAARAVNVNLTPEQVPWCVLATDGAYRPMEHLQLDDWQSVAICNSEALHTILQRCQDWEATDPLGQALPRAKRHDDKTLVAVAP